MRFEIKAATGVTHLAIEGELDAVSVSELRPDLEKLVKGRPTVVEVDLSSLRMVDSSGIGALVSLYKRIRAQGGSVVIKGLRDQPLAIFRLLRLDRVMLGADTRSPLSGAQAIQIPPLDISPLTSPAPEPSPRGVLQHPETATHFAERNVVPELSPRIRF